MEPSFEQERIIAEILTTIQSKLEDPRIHGLTLEKRRLFIEQTCDILLKNRSDVQPFRDHIIESFFPKNEDPIEKNRSLIDGFLKRIEERIRGKTPDEIHAYIRENIITSQTFLKAPSEIKHALTQEFIDRGWFVESKTKITIEPPKDTLSATRELLEELKTYQFTIDRTKDFGVIGLVEQMFPDLATKNPEEKNLITQTITDHYTQLLGGAEFAAQHDRIKALLTQQVQEWKESLGGKAPSRGKEKDRDIPIKKENGWSLDDTGKISFYGEVDGKIKKINRSVFLGGTFVDTPEKAAGLVEFLNKAEKKFPSIGRMTCDFDSKVTKITYSTPRGAIDSVSIPILQSKEDIELLRRSYAGEILDEDEKRTIQKIQYSFYNRLKDEAMNRMVKEYLKETYGIELEAKTPPPIEPLTKPISDPLPSKESVVEVAHEPRIIDDEPKPDESKDTGMSDSQKKLEELRKTFAKAEREWKQFEGVVGRLKNLITSKEKRSHIERTFAEAKEAYELARTEYVAGNIDAYVSEMEDLTQTRITETCAQKEKFWGKKLKEFFDTHHKTKMAISLSLLGIAAAVPACAFIPLSLRRIIGGLSAGFGTYNLINAIRGHSETRRQETLDREDIEAFDESRVIEEIIRLRAVAIHQGISLQDNDLYFRLMDQWKFITVETTLDEFYREEESRLDEFRKKHVANDRLVAFLSVGVSASIIGPWLIGEITNRLGATKEVTSLHGNVTSGSPHNQLVNPARQDISSHAATAVGTLNANLQIFETSHALLGTHGLTPTLHEGRITLEAHLGEHGAPKHLDQLLRRMVSEEIGKKTLDTLDKGRIENALANFRELLKGHSVSGLSPHQITSFAQFDGKTLKITDYDAYQKFMREKLLAHAYDSITPESGAVTEAVKTSSATWEHILEPKDTNTHIEHGSLPEKTSITEHTLRTPHEVAHTETSAIQQTAPQKAIETFPTSSSATVTPGSETAVVGETSFQEISSPETTSSTPVIELSSSQDFSRGLQELTTGNLSIEELAQAAAAHPKEFSDFFLKHAQEYGVSYTTIIGGKEIALDGEYISRLITDPDYGSRNVQHLLNAFQGDNRGLMNIPLVVSGQETVFEYKK